MGFKTRGMVTGKQKNGTERHASAQGDVFTQIAATNREQGGTLVEAQVRADGSGWFQLRVNGRTVEALDWAADGTLYLSTPSATRSI